MQGNFIISLDFELHWGGAEIWNLEKMQSYFSNTRLVIPQILSLFEENEIRATWATVGFLFAKDKQQLDKFTPTNKPTYINQTLSSYNYFDYVGNNEEKDPYHFAYSLIDKILKTKGQELSTHTFSHYYCNEEGQTTDQFEADLIAAQTISQENFKTHLLSIVFPRNQYNSSYLDVVSNQGIKIIRSNPNVWFWQNSYGKLTPILRALDTLFPISSSVSFQTNSLRRKNGIVELPASRFFRPYSEKEKLIQIMKMRRIKSEMTYAAENDKNYHLWWHPHNFGNYTDQNMNQLVEILDHFKVLKEKFGFSSKNMADFI